MKIKRRVYEILEVASPGDRVSKFVDIFILSLIIINIATLILETVQPLYQNAKGLFRVIEVVSVVIFSIEYLLRIWSCTMSPKYNHPVSGRLRFAITPMILLDLLAILPFYMVFLNLDLRFMRAVRLFRLTRITKLARYSNALRTLGRACTAKRAELIATFIILLFLLLISSCLMYYAEYDVQPKKFPDIPSTMWWAIATLTTVGYGDVYPITGLGQLLASIIAILGIGMFALPTGIVGAALVDEFKKEKTEPQKCPRCGALIDGEEDTPNG